MYFLKPHLFLLLLGSCLLLVSCDNSDVLEEVEDLTEEIREAYAPDKRVAIWWVRAEGSGSGIPVLRGETNLPEAKKALLDALNERNIEYSDSLRVLPEEELKETPYGLVRLSVANIRSARGHSEELSTQALMGTPLHVWMKRDNWYLVQTPDDYLGWMDEDELVLLTPRQLDRWQSSERLIYTFDFGFVYKNPFPIGETPFISDLVNGCILERAGDLPEQGFEKVRLPDGREGYVSGSLESLEEWASAKKPSTSAFLENATRYLGRPYLWGGTSGKGMDCSGFTKMAYFNFAQIIPRDASQQVDMGAEVETDSTWKNLEAGDLLFFGKKATDDSQERVTHVAFYLGQGEILHASGLVKIESLIPDDPHFAKERFDTFLKAKRIKPGADTRWLIEHPLYFTTPD